MKSADWQTIRIKSSHRSSTAQIIAGHINKGRQVLYKGLVVAAFLIYMKKMFLSSITNMQILCFNIYEKVEVIKVHSLILPYML